MFHVTVALDCLEVAEPFGPWSIRLITRRHVAVSDVVLGRFPTIVRDRLVDRLGRSLGSVRPRPLRRSSPALAVDFEGPIAAVAPLPERDALTLYWRPAVSPEDNLVHLLTYDPDLTNDLFEIVTGSVDDPSRVAVPAARLDEMIAAREDQRPAHQQPTGGWSPVPHRPVDVASFVEASRHRRSERNGSG